MVIDFCFQAEDGIRDLVRSRGLGDVYKRQIQKPKIKKSKEKVSESKSKSLPTEKKKLKGRIIPVSYTHLTLPTSDLV